MWCRTVWRAVGSVMMVSFVVWSCGSAPLGRYSWRSQVVHIHGQGNSGCLIGRCEELPCPLTGKKVHHEYYTWQLVAFRGRVAFVTPGRRLASRPAVRVAGPRVERGRQDRKSTRLNSSHVKSSYAVC